jgi:hypothetical protein
MADSIEKYIDGITDLESAKGIIRLLLRRIAALEEEVAKLSKNSNNSSKPPSSDIVKPEHERRKPGER